MSESADLGLPDAVRQNVSEWFGRRGREWLDALPATTAVLADRWQLRLGPPYAGGTHSLVLPVTRADGSPAVLKVPVRDDENTAEAAALRAYAGDGAVRLFEYDETTGAMLLERAEPGSSLEAHTDRAAALVVAFALLRRLRRRPPPGIRFPLAVDLAAAWATRLPARQRELRLPGADGLVEEAAALAGAYSASPAAEALLVNRDAHLGNVLRAQRERWLLIDPKPVVGEAAFEAGQPVISLLGGPGPGFTRSGAGEAPPGRADRVVTAVAIGLGVDPARVRGWSLIRSVADALWRPLAGGDPARDLAVARAIQTMAT